VLIRLCAATLADDDPDGWRDRCRRLGERPGEEGEHWLAVGAVEPLGEATRFDPIEGGLAENEDSGYNLPGSRRLLDQLRSAWSAAEIMAGASVRFLFEDEG
jgi:hypothetical protein